MSGYELPIHLRQLMNEVGSRWGCDAHRNAGAICEAFTPLLAIRPKPGRSLATKVNYGPAEAQVLDVYGTEDGQAKPVVLFVHGRSFAEGSRAETNEIPANVLHYIARHEMIGVNVEYRRAAEAVYPSGLIDLRLAMDWIYGNIDEFGGDPDNVFLMGHAAGAAHAAAYAYDQRAHKPPAQPRGLIVVSGRLNVGLGVDDLDEKDIVSYYGDPAIAAALSPVNFVSKDSVPTFIAFAEFENPFVEAHCLDLAHRLTILGGKSPRLIQLPLHNHTSIIAHINTAEDVLGREIRAFITRNAQSSAPCSADGSASSVDQPRRHFEIGWTSPGGR